MSPIRARKSLGGKWFRVNFTLRSVAEFLRDWVPDGHVDPGRRPWSSITIGPRGFSYNTRRRTGRVGLPGPFSYETPRLERDAFDSVADLGRHDMVRLERGAVRGHQHCGHWYDHPDWPCCRCGYNGTDETPCPGQPRDGLPPVHRSQVANVDAIEQPSGRRENASARWTDENGQRWQRTANATGGTTTRYLPDPVSDDEAEQESCPRCCAEPGSPCRTRGTGRPTKPHLPRVELARLARAHPAPDRQFSCEHGAPADTRCDLCDTPPWGTPPR